ncbi:hypothetical protein [Chamaesiphon minutus]|uniref:Uncharacterized protein n=1 Tax=Chamaesiphon minutus (strain ATCC 27169 / PCC 6605) TaxID=1173020 RepID=K9UGL5_CHAP6|nr:hypothetical protein [Chamaesiphon minutus]AFY93339.1 hypothetical protein Cha6605_2256 [Chamaesiphon minutus PCC 6605]
MTFSKSNLNLLPESLFTELTADQAQMLEGGKRVTILSARCIKAGNGSDKLFFTVNGQNVMFGRTISMQAGSVANVGVGGNFDGDGEVRLFDTKVSNNTLMGIINASSNGTQTRLVGGSGSLYEVTFRTTN